MCICLPCVFPKSFSHWQTRGQHVHRHVQPTEVWHQQRDKFLDRTPQDDPVAAGKMSNFLSSQTQKNKLRRTSKFRFKSVSCQIGERKKNQLQLLNFKCWPSCWDQRSWCYHRLVLDPRANMLGLYVACLPFSWFQQKFHWGHGSHGYGITNNAKQWFFTFNFHVIHTSFANPMKHSDISLSCDLWIGKVVEVIEIQSFLVLPRPGKNKTSASESTVRLPYLITHLLLLLTHILPGISKAICMLIGGTMILHQELLWTKLILHNSSFIHDSLWNQIVLQHRNYWKIFFCKRQKLKEWGSDMVRWQAIVNFSVSLNIILVCFRSCSFQRWHPFPAWYSVGGSSLLLGVLWGTKGRDRTGHESRCVSINV